MIACAVKDMSVRYPGGVQALKDISLDFPQGSFTCVLGPSGSGKSTLLSVIAGVLPRYQRMWYGARKIILTGDVYLNGVCANKLLPSERGLSILPQQVGLFPHLSPKQNVLVGLGDNKQQEDQEALLVKALQLAQVDPSLLQRYSIEELSGGQQQRLALARLIINTKERPLRLCDEPLNSLDAVLQRELVRELRRLHEASSGVTTIYVTHRAEEMLALADRVVVLLQGQVVFVGTPEELVHNPRSLPVAQLLDDVSIVTESPTSVEAYWPHELHLDRSSTEHLVVSSRCNVRGRYQTTVRYQGKLLVLETSEKFVVGATCGVIFPTYPPMTLSKNAAAVTQ